FKRLVGAIFCDHDSQRYGRDLDNRRKTVEIVRGLAEIGRDLDVAQAGIDQRVAVFLAIDHKGGADNATAAGTIDNHDGRTDFTLDRISPDTCGEVRITAGAIWHDDLYGFIGIVRHGRCSDQTQGQGTSKAGKQGFVFHDDQLL